MKALVNIMIFLFCVAGFSQEQRVEYKKTDNNMVKATYYFADNSDIIQREGFFNSEGKLHGTWISYDVAGNKTAIANYNNGVKEGVWTYYKNDKVSFVTYKNNKIINVEEKAIALN